MFYNIITKYDMHLCEYFETWIGVQLWYPML